MLLLGFVLVAALAQAQKNYAVMLIDSKTGNPITTATIKLRSTGQVIPISQAGNALVTTIPQDTLLVRATGYTDREILLALQSSAFSVVMQPKIKNKPVAARPKKSH